MAELLYTFYGDDFTGSTDVLEQLATGGVRAALFLAPPTAAELRRMPHLQAFGVAGDSRSQTPAWMSTHLPSVLMRVRAFGAPVTHYKVCSTFDSSPERGSIGRALEIGREVFGSALVPVVVGAPHLRRYVHQGRLFAADPAGLVQRIDRHPMRHHPVTPMREPSLRKHLGAQTALSIGEVFGVARAEDIREAWHQAEMSGCEALIIDTVDRGDLLRVGQALWSEAKRKPLFGVGSSGFTAALIAAWREAGALAKHEEGAVILNSVSTEPVRQPSMSAPLLVVSGSCSAATGRQLRWALANGFEGVPLDPAELLGAARGEVIATAITSIRNGLAGGRDVVVYTSIGTPARAAHGEQLGIALGQLLRNTLVHTHTRRVVLCGGDTSSHAVQQLDVRALTWKANLQPGAPLCEAHGEGVVDGLELVLKGGQVGTDEFFAAARDA